MKLTYQTRPQIDENQDIILCAYSQLHNKVEHSLYAEIAKGKTAASCKNDFLKQFGLTARQFNACKVSLEGKIASSHTSQTLAITHLEKKIESLDKQIQQLKGKPFKRFALHQKQRRRSHLEERLKHRKEDKAAGRVPLCFGGKKLFRAQFHLEKSGFSSHDQWRQAWETKRNSEFFVLGSKDETSGNQTCVAKVAPNGKLHLRLRLPRALEKKYGKYLEIENLIFAYGHDAIVAGKTNTQFAIASKKTKKGEESLFLHHLKTPKPIQKKEEE